MQLAARQVAWENTQLRELLAINGVSREGIEDFLRGRERTAVHARSMTVTRTEIPSITATQPHADGPIEGLSDHKICGTWEPEIRVGEEADRSTEKIEANICPEPPVRTGDLKEKVPRQGSPTQKPGPGKGNWGCDASDQPCAIDDEGNNILPAVSECFCPDLPPSSLSSLDELMLEMSCETAASIISSMRGGGHQADARSLLGCEGQEHCTVKNMKVMQLIEMN